MPTLNQITEFAYNAQHKVTSITAPGGLVSSFDYYLAGSGRGQLSKAHPAAYEAGKFDHYTYDAWGNLDTVKRGTTNPGDDAPVDAYTYTARGDLQQIIDRRGAKTTFTYNQRRQPRKVIQWDGATAVATSETAYDDAGDVDYTLDASGRKTDTEHNALGDATEVRQGAVQAVVLSHTYNTRNLLATSAVPYDGALRTTAYAYTATQALASATDPLGRTTAFGYDDDLRRTSVTTPLGSTSTTLWDSRSFKDGETDAENRTADYAYDKDGRPVTLANRLNQSFSWTYADADRTVTTVTPTGKTTVSILNPRGLPQTVTEPSGQVATFSSYDAEGRLLSRSDGAGTATFTYHANGLPHTVTENGRTTTRTYDALNRLASYSDGEGNIISYTYHPSGELHTLTYPGNKTIAYTYDDFGRLWKVTDWNNKTTTYSYWENGLLRKITRPNGTEREQSYDAAGQLCLVRETSTGGLFAFQELRYDADGRIDYSFLHPMLNPIVLPSDDLLFDSDNRLSSFNGDTSVAYDADGNLVRGPGLTGGVPGPANFAYDARNRLTSHGGSGYRYNPDGLRVEVTGTSSCTYVVDPNAALTRTLMRTKGGVTTYYIYGLGLLYECDAGGNSARYYHADQVGSTVALTDATGNVTDRWSYAPFGTEFRAAGATETPFRFNGEFGVITEASGLVYMRARYYHPRLMRFCNADPIGFAGGMNWYAFAGNDPVSRLDPFGLKDGAGSATRLPDYVRRWTPADEVAYRLWLASNAPNSGGGSEIISSNTANGIDVAGNMVGAAAAITTGEAAQAAARQAAQGGARPSFRGVSVAEMRQMAHTGSANAAQLARVGRTLSATGVAGNVVLAGVDVYQSGGSNRSFARTGVSAAVTSIGIAGGPIGAGVALGFSALNAAGAFDGFYNYFDNRSRFGRGPGG